MRLPLPTLQDPTAPEVSPVLGPEVLEVQRRPQVGAAIGGAALVTTGVIARRGVGEVETAVFHRVNRLPDAFFRAI